MTGQRDHDRQLRRQQQEATAAAVQRAVEAPGLEAAVTDLEASFTEKFKDFISGELPSILPACGKYLAMEVARCCGVGCWQTDSPYRCSDQCQGKYSPR